MWRLFPWVKDFRVYILCLALLSLGSRCAFAAQNGSQRAVTTAESATESVPNLPEQRSFGNLLIASAAIRANVAAFVPDESSTGLGSSSVSSPTFLVAPSVPLSGSPTAVSVGDLDNDGKLDLVVANSDAGTVDVLLGEGNGSFRPAVHYTASKTPAFVALGDFNGDGHLDVAVADQADNTISILLGRGDGTLQKSVTYKGVSGPAYVVVGDFNSDGHPDLAVAATFGNSVAILLNKSDGTFYAAVPYSVGMGPRSLTVADFNGDGLLDLASANSGGTVSILFGKGEGRFQAAVTFDAGTGSLSSLVAGDFNGDGKPDLAIADSSDRNVSVLLGNGDGTFQTRVNYSVGNSPASLVLADVNGDNVPDLVSANKSGNTVSILLGNGNGTFKTGLDFSVGNSPVGIAIGDFNGDGHLDLVTANFADHTLSVPLGNGDGTFKAARDYSTDLERKSVAVGDLNGDGNPDLVVTNFCGADGSCAGNGTASVLLAKGDGTYEEPVSYPLGRGPISVTLADINDDKKLDLMVANRDDNTVQVLLGNGDGTFQSAVSYAAGNVPVSLTAGDFNNDGKMDLAVANQCGSGGCREAGDVSVLLGNGDGSFHLAGSYSVGFSPSSVATGDLNGDRNLDLVVANACGKDNSCRSNGTASVLIGNGKGTFTSKAELDLGKHPSSVALGDLDGDGKIDLLVANTADNKVSVLLGNGDGTFKEPVAYKVGSSPSSVVIADFDGDGKKDVAVANTQDSTISLLFGNGDGGLNAAFNYSVGAGPVALAAVANRNRTIDLVSANGDARATPAGSDITVLMNVSTLTTPAACTTAASITATAGTPQSATVRMDFLVNLAATVLDGNNNPVPGCVVTFTAPGVAPSGFFADGKHTTTATTDAIGVATASTFTAGFKAGSYIVNAKVKNVASPAPFDLTNLAGAPATITPTAGTPQSAMVNAPFATDLAATVQDKFGNPVPNVTVTFTAPNSAPSGTFANGTNTTTATTNASGVATASTFTADTKTGSYTVSATLGVLTPAPFDLTNLPGAPASITPTAGTPQSATVNTPFAKDLAATVKDQFGNPVPNVTVTFTSPGFAPSGFFANGKHTTTATTNASGVATASTFTAGTVAGSYTVKATVNGVSSPAPFDLTNLPGAPASIAPTAGTPQSATVSTPFLIDLAATVKDKFGNPVPNVTVTFTAPKSAPSGTFANGTNTTTATTNASGIATASTFTADTKTGSYTVDATVKGVSTPARFSLTNTAGAPASITPSAGTPQSTTVNTPFATDLAATVKDKFGNPVPNVTVTFTAPSSAPSGTFANGTNTTTATTNASGAATASTFTADTKAGSYTVNATVNGVSTPAPFSLTNKSGAAAAVTPTAGTPQSAIVNNVFRTDLAATVEDKFGNPVPNVAVTFTAPNTPPSGTFANGTNTTTAPTNISGVATATPFVADGTPGNGAYTVMASVSGATPASYSLTNEDFSVALSSGSVTAVQGSAATATLTASALNGYAGTITPICTGLPAGASCSFNPRTLALPGSATSMLKISTSGNTPVGSGPITVTGTDGSVVPVSHTAPLTLSVKCTFALENPSLTNAGPPPAYSFNVVETAGGSNCPWTATATSEITLTTHGGTNTAVNSAKPVNYQVAATASAGSITVSYFGGSSILAVSPQSPQLLPSVVEGQTVTAVLMPSQFGSGTSLQFPLLPGQNSVCSVANGPVTSPSNFGITCSAPTTLLPRTVPLTINVSSTTLSSLRRGHSPSGWAALALGIPGIVFLGAGPSGLGTRRGKRRRRRLVGMLGLGLVVLFVSLLPACGGGFKANLTAPGTSNTYTLTVMGVVTGAGNQVLGTQIFTLSIPVLPQ